MPWVEKGRQMSMFLCLGFSLCAFYKGQDDTFSVKMTEGGRCVPALQSKKKITRRCFSWISNCIVILLLFQIFKKRGLRESHEAGNETAMTSSGCGTPTIRESAINGICVSGIGKQVEWKPRNGVCDVTRSTHQMKVQFRSVVCHRPRILTRDEGGRGREAVVVAAGAGTIILLAWCGGFRQRIARTKNFWRGGGGETTYF